MAGRERGAAGWLERTLAAPALVQAMAVAARLGIFDLVRDQPKSALLLASAAGVHPEALTRLLRALAAEGVLDIGEDGRFGATPVADLLCRQAPGDYLERLLALANREWEAWGGLLQAVETGRPAAPRAGGEGFAPPPGAADALRRAAGEVPRPGWIVGSPAARAWLERAWRAPSPGVPLAAGGGLSCLGEAESAAEVAAAHAALPPGGRLLLLEPVLPADPRAAPGLALRDLELLALGRGRLRGLEEWRKLFERAGLRFDGAAPVKGTAGWMVLTASRGLV